ncbi:MAG: TOBE domain-containing protein, partial [Waterburya sp.]
AISDKIAVMRQGKIEHVGTPEEVYLNPASRFVAEFVTQANFLPATNKGLFWLTEIGEIALSQSELPDHNYVKAETGDLMLRPEEILLIPDPDSKIVVRERQFLGREYYYGIETASGKRIYARTNLDRAIAVGTNVSISLTMNAPRIFTVSSEINKFLASA